ncbi:hypothetical protein PPYR_06237 [Photinus pyralis]|uniref:RRM domain-containing protein n=1 Tax=Photinus pyralis TaxID=7054 RepID=A0A1Y1K418_PHOPY|nr:RNA-binding protein 7 [Photinus pyralis]KAB0800497.1 hypothetical protein PPYR_06237 [Photinus pyralis]
MNDNDEDQRTVWCGNLSEKITEDILYELFLQAAPLEKVKIPKDKTGRYTSYGFVTFKHLCSVPYAIDLLNGISLYDKRINVKPRLANARQNLNFVQAAPLLNIPPIVVLNNGYRGTDGVPDVNLLMSLGEQLLPNTQNHFGNNYNMDRSNNWRDSNYRSNRREKHRPYRRHGNYYQHDDRYHSNR